MGTRCRLGVILHGENWQLAMPEPFDRTIVEVHVGHFELLHAGDPPLPPFHGETMILGRDEHPPRSDITHGMISATMAIRHLDRARPVGEPYDLMPKADAEYRDI